MRRPYLPPVYKLAEWRHVLSIVSSHNVTVVGGTLSDAGGDGIEVSGGNHPSLANFSSDVTLRGLIISRAWRNGLSIISARGSLTSAEPLNCHALLALVSLTRGLAWHADWLCCNAHARVLLQAC